MGENTIKIIEQYQKDPVEFFKKTWGVPIWRGQEEILNAVATCPRIVVGSGHALGKDYIAGAIALWFLYCFAPSKVIMTAPSERQVKSIMWMELSRHFNTSKYSPLDGDLKNLKLTLRPDWFVEGFTTKEANQQVGKFQGYHSPNILVIVSEAQAVDAVIYDQIDGLLTSGNSKLLLIGNPITTSGRYVQELKNTTRNKVIQLSCLDNPNYLEKKEVIPGLATYEWVEDKRARWGEGDPRWQGRVLGIVPEQSIDTVMPEALYLKCQNRELITWTKKFGTIGVDPARFGDDDMVISVFESGKLLDEIVRPKCSATEGASLVVQAQKKWFPEGQIAIIIDCDGLGGPYLDMIRQMVPDELSLRLIEFHGSSTDKEVVTPGYKNLRAEAAFYAKEQMEKGMISLDDDEWAREEALTEKYFVNLRGDIQLEDKTDIKERIGRSPGKWDARKLAIWGFKFADPIKKRDGWKDRRSNSIAPDLDSFMAT